MSQSYKMEPDELTDQVYWEVLQRIKKNAFFNPSFGPVVFGYASEIEIGALLDLQDKGVIKLLNLSRFPDHIFTIASKMPEEIKLEIESGFDELYRDYKKKVETKIPSQVDESNDDPKLSTVRKDNRELRKEITLIIRNKRFGIQEKEFLQFLAKRFKPEQIKDIGSEIGSKDCKHLKLRVQKKLEGTDFRIVTIRAKRFYDNSSYQLECYPH